MNEAPRPVAGYGKIVLAALLWGTAGPLSVALMRMGTAPESLALLRPLLGTAGLLLAALVTNPGSLRVPGRGLLFLLVPGGIAVGVFQVSFQFSMESVGIPTTVGLLYLAPAMVMLAAGPVLNEWPRPATVVFGLFSVLGVWMMIWGSGNWGGSGGTLVWGAISGVAMASYTLFGRAASPVYGALATTLYSTMAGTVLIVIAGMVGLLEFALPPSFQAWALVVVFALTSMTLASFLFFDGIRHVRAPRAAIVTTLEPVVAAILAALFIGQGMSWVGWTGLSVVVGGVAGAYLIGPSRSADG